MEIPSTVRNVLSKLDDIPSNAIKAENFILTREDETLPLSCIVITPY